MCVISLANTFVQNIQVDSIKRDKAGKIVSNYHEACHNNDNKEIYLLTKSTYEKCIKAFLVVVTKYMMIGCTR